MMESKLTFPPAPKTVDITCPNGRVGKYRAYTHDGIQRVVWDPEQGCWVPNLEICQWQKMDSVETGYSLTTKKTRKNSGLRSSKFQTQIKALEKRLASLEEDNSQLHKQILWMADQFGIVVPD